MTEMARGQPTHDESLHHPNRDQDENPMTETNQHVQRVQEELTKFQTTMEELRELRSVADELRNFRKMIRLKRYD
jgi:benzoyl-CoA reductase/2-hydroxyglutaryl-CoA dehydratase subunit BcrC/BadD/HgdB